MVESLWEDLRVTIYSFPCSITPGALICRNITPPLNISINIDIYLCYIFITVTRARHTLIMLISQHMIIQVITNDKIHLFYA